MKVISWNVNGARSSELPLIDLMEREKPDVLLLQEIKCSAGELRAMFNFHFKNYVMFVSESYRTGHFGVATIVRREWVEDLEGNRKPDFEVATSPIDFTIEGNQEGRLLAMVKGKTLILNTYTVNVRRDLSRVDIREAYDEYVMGLIDGFKQHRGVEKVIYMGDLNVVPEAKDYHGNEIRPKTAGMTSVERMKFFEFKERLGLVDAYRELYPNKIAYTYFSFIGNARELNRGWRIDHALISQNLVEDIEDVEILDEVYSSDHVPLLLTLKD